ncbi:hypothetical protein J5N97_010090 [Dioscorea zingiberensis]|uniref:Uncharacterized protein n=1 Tax=Dioscorea zingiberensis TaxID=325984 RepID=A0A9D5D0Q0_9LILI|nr:hypothetical protein J5N97_010090 [Dioscorea zingiberensis]
MQQHRRLFELLEEQQEPFMLDVYLMENGLKCKATTTSPLCWPSHACMKLGLSFKIHGVKRKRGWLLNFILSKLLPGKALQKVRNGGMVSAFEEVDEEVESSRQLSPVSVLHFQSVEGSPLPTKNEQESNTIREPSDMFGELHPLKPKQIQTCLDSDNARKAISEFMVFSLEKKRKQWGPYQRQVREIGTEIELVIFEEMREELVLDLLDLKRT